VPWVNQEMCTGCGTCEDECPVGAVEVDSNGLASIKDADCIRCGRCHDVCPEEAVRHDSERIPQEVAANLQWVRGLLDHFETASEREAFMDRIRRYFNKQKKVIEKTLTALETVGDEDTAAGLDAAVRSLLGPRNRGTN